MISIFHYSNKQTDIHIYVYMNTHTHTVLLCPINKGASLMYTVFVLYQMHRSRHWELNVSGPVFLKLHGIY